MTQLSAPSAHTLPGIVTDQPEIFESEPVLSDDTGINDIDLTAEPHDDAIAIIQVPIKQAFSYFAERENEIAKFYVQRHGEYKISGDKAENETDVEKYHRLVSEVNQLLGKFQTEAQKSEKKASLIGSLNNDSLVNNLDVLSRQLKALEFAAKDGSLNSYGADLNALQSKLDKLESQVEGHETNAEARCLQGSDETARLIRMSALERRLNALETLLGHKEEETASLFKMTKCDNLNDVAETLGSWLSFFKPDGVQRVNQELDYLTQRLEKVQEQAAAATAGDESSENKLTPQARGKIDQLFGLVTATDKYRALVPTILHRLNAMEELQRKAASVVTTANHLEQVQSQIVESLQSNQSSVSSLNEMFRKNMESIREFHEDIEKRIRHIKEGN